MNSSILNKKGVRERTGVFIALLVSCLVIFCLFHNPALESRAVFSSVLNDIHFENGMAVYGDTYGRIDSVGPYYELQKGTYRLRWKVHSDGDNHMVLFFLNDVGITPREISLPAGVDEGEVEFDVLGDGRKLQMDIFYDSGSFFEIEQFTLVTRAYKDNAFRLSFVIAALFIIFTCWQLGIVKREHLPVIFFLVAETILTSLCLSPDRLILGDDSGFHLARLENLVSGLRDGQFPVRCGAFTYNGFGAVTSVFYPDLFLYPFAFMRLLGASVVYTMHIYMIAVNLLSSIAMYIAAKRMLKDTDVSLWCSSLYTFSMYRLGNVYSRFSVGEAMAMVFLPLFVMALYELVFCNGHPALLGLTAAGIFMSHLITTLLCALGSVVFCLIYIKEIISRKRLVPLLGALVIAGAATSFCWAPMAYFRLKGIGIDQLGGYSYVMEMAELFNSSSRTGIGTVLLLGVTMAAVQLLCRKDIASGTRNILTFCIVAGVTLSALSVFQLFWQVVNRFTGFNRYIQFSWRLLGPAMVFLCLCGGFGMAGFLHFKRRWITWCLALLIPCYMASSLLFIQNEPVILRFGLSVDPQTNYLEYTLPGTQINWSNRHDIWTEGDVTLGEWRKDGTHFDIQVETEQGAVLSLPVFGYPGYEAEVSGEKLQTGIGQDNRLTVFLPQNTHDLLHVHYAGFWWFKIVDILSLLTWIVCFVSLVRPEKRISSNQSGRKVRN